MGESFNTATDQNKILLKFFHVGNEYHISSKFT